VVSAWIFVYESAPAAWRRLTQASVPFAVHSDTSERLLSWFCFLPLHASSLYAGSTVATLRTTGFKTPKACISFKKFVYLLPVILRINSNPPLPKRTKRLFFVMESKYFCSVGTGFTCWLVERNAWRVILSCFLYAYLYFLFCYFPPFIFCFIIFSFPSSPFLCFSTYFYSRAFAIPWKATISSVISFRHKNLSGGQNLWTFVLGC
jgi:hypothetical protein